MRFVGYILNYKPDYLLNDMLNHMIINLVTTALQELSDRLYDYISHDLSITIEHFFIFSSKK